MDNVPGRAEDYLLISHPDGRGERILVPITLTRPLRVGRETGNDIVLSDGRVSRYHAEIRRSARGLEIRDVGSVNGILLGTTRLPAKVWQELPARVTLYLGSTGLSFEPSPASEATVSMQPVLPPAPTEPVRPPRSGRWAGWLLLAGALLVLLIAVGFLAWQYMGRQGVTGGTVQLGTGRLVGNPTVSPPPSTSAFSTTSETARLAYPALQLIGVRVEPIMFGALPDPSQAFIIVEVRVENLGTDEFTLTSQQFQLLDASGLVVSKEAGGGYSDSTLRKLGLANRFQNLRLGPGDSVSESLLFAAKVQPYHLLLQFEPPGGQAIVLDLGKLNAQDELARLLGTSTPAPVTSAPATSARVTATLLPAPTPTRPGALPTPKMVPAASLVGTIAYPVFNGTTYDLYLHNLGDGSNRLLLNSASQPQFSPDGKRLAYHSWQSDKRGLVTVDVSGGNEHIVASNLEDQLPTWSPDGSQLIFLSRRSGQRASELFLVPSQGGEARVIGNGEYPSWAPDGRLVFKGWEATGVGLRLAGPDLSDLQSLTDQASDTAPAVSPDGKQVAFMSQRDGDWDVYVVNSDGSGLRQLTNDPASDGLPVWSPDGKAIAFASNRGGPWAVWAVTPEGSGSRQLFTMPGTPDGFVVNEDRDKSRGWAEERISWTR